MLLINAIDHCNSEENFKKNVKCKWKTCVYGKQLKIAFITPDICSGNWEKENCPNHKKITAQ